MNAASGRGRFRDGGTASPEGWPAPRLVLVTAAPWIGARSGPGQRTQMIFRALQRLGPVEVACLGAPDPARLGRAFPGAAGLHPIAGSVFGAPAGPLAALGRLLQPSRAYRPDAAVGAALGALLPPGTPALFVFRFARLYCVAGLAADAAAGRHCIVDVDDRDDHRAAAQLARLLPRPLARPALLRGAVAGIRGVLRRRLAAATAVWVVKPADRLDALGLPVEVVPNAPAAASAAEALPPPSAATGVLFVGNGSHDANRGGIAWFLRRVWPTVRARCPDARLRIAGIGRWAEGLGRLARADGVTVVGAVPAVLPEYAAARLVICPLFVAAGSQLKLIEACAHGRPVVCTTAVAGGFGTPIAARLALADRPAAFSAAVCRYLAQPAAADADGAELARLQRAGFAAEAVEAAIARSLGRLLAPAGATLAPVARDTRMR